MKLRAQSAKGKRQQNMSKSDKTASAEALEDQTTDSVYDFLYHDVRRVGSFLAQFDYFGHLQSIVHNESVAKGVRRGYNLKLGGSVPVPGAVDSAEASVTFGRDPDQKGSESQERVYDPLWTNALALLDYLAERHLLQRDISKAQLGQIVLVSGKLSIRDLKMAKDILHAPALRKALVRGLSKSTETNTPVELELKTPNERTDFVLGMLNLLPHSVQLSLQAKDGTFWGTLNEGAITGTPSDLVAKYGNHIPGEWSIVGILDGLPDDQDPSVKAASDKQKPEDTSADPQKAMFGLVDRFTDITRKLLGRPQKTYAITPLLIFREVCAER